MEVTTVSLPVILLALTCVALAARAARRLVRRLALLGGVLVAAAMHGGALIDSDAEHMDRWAGRVLQVADGDTLTVHISSGALRVRLLGIDAPESSTLRLGHAECGGADSARHLRALAQPRGRGARVRVIPDPHSRDSWDAYGRMLAYVDGRDGDLGEAQLRAGHAALYRHRHRRFSRLARYRRAERQARSRKRGAWRTCRSTARAAGP
jgi:endonuclease YncB( thermonuclease family)